jgi:hypothetical protein
MGKYNIDVDLGFFLTRSSKIEAIPSGFRWLPGTRWAEICGAGEVSETGKAGSRPIHQALMASKNPPAWAPSLKGHDFWSTSSNYPGVQCKMAITIGLCANQFDFKGQYLRTKNYAAISKLYPHLSSN